MFDSQDSGPRLAYWYLLKLLSATMIVNQKEAVSFGTSTIKYEYIYANTVQCSHASPTSQYVRLYSVLTGTKTWLVSRAVKMVLYWDPTPPSPSPSVLVSRSSRTDDKRLATYRKACRDHLLGS